MVTPSPVGSGNAAGAHASSSAAGSPASSAGLALSFALFGPPIAWSVHLISAALIAEWGCIAGHHEPLVLGVTPIAWGVIGVTVVTALTAAAGTWVGLRAYRRDRGGSTPVANEDSTHQSIASMASLTGAVFVLIIVAESIPVLFFVRGC